MGIGNFVGGHQPGAGGAKGVAAFAFVPGTAAFNLEFTLRNVVNHAVTGDVAHRVLFADVASALANNHAQLHFPVRFKRVTRDLYLIVRPDHRAGPFVEHYRLGGDRRAGFRRMVGIIEANADKFADAAHARPQSRLPFHPRQLVDVQRTQFVQGRRQQRISAQVSNMLRQIADLPVRIQYSWAFLSRCAVT
ncbi:hypothetical protein D3C72_1640880 [compost metagenome]